MNPNQDRSPYYIEHSLLLRFLIVRYTEMLETEKPNLAPVWAGLGMVGLRQNLELKYAFQTLFSSSYTAQEVLTTSIDLFLTELHGLQATDSVDYVPKEIERRPLRERTARKFLFWCWSEGRKIKRERDFRFYPIWEVLAYQSLTSDEYVEEFERRCRVSQSSLETRLDDGLEIVKTAIFRRSIADALFRRGMPTGTRIDTENNHVQLTISAINDSGLRSREQDLL